MPNIDWWSLVSGGALIGLSAAILIIINGKIAGVSGIVGEVIHGQSGLHHWRLWFLAGLLAPALWQAHTAITFVASTPVLAVAGLLVGVGVSIGSGCTSGHGVCGIANFSRRSLLATIVFMTTAFITVYVVKHLLGQ